MKQLELKRINVFGLGIALLLIGVFFAYEYVTEPKMVDGVISKSIDDEGKPKAITTEFKPEETVYFSAKRNRFWINKAEIVWYKGDILTENRILVQEEVEVNKAGYFTGALSFPEGLEEGHYGVTIYVDGAKVMETKAEFTVKK